MSGDVKRKRPYRSERRREQAEQTRTRILDAAGELFVDGGFAGTSVAAIASRAGVSAETVYQAFGSKPALLDALVRRAARLGDEAPIPEQAGPRAVVAEHDQRTQLQLFAADIVRRLERVGPLMRVVDAAAVSAPAIAELQGAIDRARRAGLAEFVDALSARGPLAVDRAVAVDTVWALASSDLQQLLMRRRGWSRTAYTT
ncbi:MAG TPA: helix-turn-helix domain-containing protein, partial [Gaiellales bacterium]|nr:helix-turn-helix domain-containing protein [Gaiellales bacterium]